MTRAAEIAKMGEVLTNSQIGGRRNIVINGAMQVAQRATSATGLGGSDPAYQTLDRFRMNIGGTSAGRFTMAQVADVHDGFANALKLTCTTADTSIAADEVLSLQTRLEAQNLQQLKKGTSDAEKVTVSFYVKGNASATYTLELEDENSRRIADEFSVTTNWTRVVKTFGGDTSGSIGDDNALGLSINIFLHGGSNFTSGTFSANTWESISNTTRLSDNQTSFFDSTDRTFFITGLQMEVGEQATPFEHRSFGEELLLCQRYFEFINGGMGCAMTTGTANGNFCFTYRADKRASATAALVGTPVVNDGSQQSNINSIVASYHSFTSGIFLDLSTGTVNNNEAIMVYSTSATVGFSFDAEL